LTASDIFARTCGCGGRESESTLHGSLLMQTRNFLLYWFALMFAKYCYAMEIILDTELKIFVEDFLIFFFKTHLSQHWPERVWRLIQIEKKSLQIISLSNLKLEEELYFYVLFLFLEKVSKA
jgi:hypothetical protein